MTHPTDLGSPTRPRRRATPAAPEAPTLRRCAIYCRKSVEERVATDFGSIDAQRESCEAFIRSQASLGWRAVATRYEDEGYTGANTDRPSLAQLLADVEAGRIDVVVVYKIDRLSRSIGDFVRLSEQFDRHGVAFVSVTQQFNTTTSAGRLTLNLLTVFAQFERETISERTRDKMRAARRRGKYTGGAPILGYERHPEGRRLVVQEDEAVRVRALFSLYAELRSLTAVVAEANTRGWTTKVRVSKRGRAIQGRRFTTTYLRGLLRNPTYVGQVHQDGAVYAAEHPGIVPMELFEKVQSLRAADARPGGRTFRAQGAVLLGGLLRCAPCGAPMAATHTTRRGRQYRYYLCRTTRREGWAACPSPSVPAHELERLVVDQIRGIGRDPVLQAATLEAARAQAPDQAIDPIDLRRALTLWDDLWAALSPREQGRVLRLLIAQVSYDGAAGTVALAFHPTGIATLAQDVPA